MRTKSKHLFWGEPVLSLQIVLYLLVLFLFFLVGLLFLTLLYGYLIGTTGGTETDIAQTIRSSVPDGVTEPSLQGKLK